MNIPIPLTVVLAAALSACTTLPNQHTFTPVMPRVGFEDKPLPPEAVTGSLFRDGRELRLFEDRTARRVGDILTIRLLERTNASKRASSSADKSSEIGLANPTLFGSPVSLNGNDLSASVAGERTFEGGGAADQSNSLTGQISAVVVEVLPSGALVIRGEKMLTLNQGREFVQISGVVRPEDIRADNSVLSSQVADAQITYAGTGTLADASAVGWLGRFFLSPLWPF